MSRSTLTRSRQATPMETAKAAPPHRWGHDEHCQEDGHAVTLATRGRQPRSDPHASIVRTTPRSLPAQVVGSRITTAVSDDLSAA